MTDADLTALWSAWFKDRTLHRGCNLISAIVREMADCRAVEAPPAAEETNDWVSLTWRTGKVRLPAFRIDDDPTGTDPYPPQIKPPQSDPELLALLEIARINREAIAKRERRLSEEGTW